MRQCKVLREYATFVERIRYYRISGLSQEEAVDATCKYCIEHDILKEYLLKHRNEVMQLILTEYDEKKHLSNVARNARKSGKIEGKIEGKAESVLELLLEMGDIPKELDFKIREQKDLGVLGKWLKLAAKAETIEEFTDNMNQ